MLKEIQKHKGMVLNHTVDHISLVGLSDKMIIDQVTKASNKIKLKLGIDNPKVFLTLTVRVVKELKKFGRTWDLSCVLSTFCPSKS